MPYHYDSSSPLLLGLEIGESGTYFAAYRETASGPIRRRRRASAPTGPEEALSLIRDLLVRTIYDLSPEEQNTDRLLPPLRLGIALWGQLDRDRQAVLMLRQNESWSGFLLAEALAAPQVVELATRGNAIAADILAVAEDALSLAIANALLLLSPDEIVIGGPLTAAGEDFLRPLRAHLALLLGDSATVPAVRMGRFEPFSVLSGAYALARDG